MWGLSAEIDLITFLFLASKYNAVDLHMFQTDKLACISAQYESKVNNSNSKWATVRLTLAYLASTGKTSTLHARQSVRRVSTVTASTAKS